MIVLGIGGSTHDFSACLVVDGVVAVAVEEERLSRIKHHSLEQLAIGEFRLRAVDYCLDALDLTLGDVDVIVANDLVHRGALRGLRDVRKVDHHLSHAALVSYLCPDPDLALLVIDGFGSMKSNEAEIVSYFVAGNDRWPRLVHREYGAVRRLDPSRPFSWKNFDVVDDSLGELYSWVTRRIGFGLHDEGKTMGLAPLGSDALTEQLQETVRLDSIGGVRFDATTRAALDELMPIPPEQGEDWCVRADYARAAQDLLELALLRRANDLCDRTGARNIGLGGGVFLNSAANRRILREGPFSGIALHGATGDSGTAIGAALLAYADMTGRTPEPGVVVYTGREYDDRQIRDELQQTSGIEWHEGDPTDRAARALATGQIVGWFQGGSEFGRRALGNRSILADPGAAGMKDRINRVVKHRESFRPFAPSVLIERQAEVLDSATEGFFMCVNAQVRPEILNRLECATHIDGSARYQSVGPETNIRYHRLMTRFAEITGTPALLNTSFNDSEPIVETPKEALASFLRTDIDCLAIGDHFVTKTGAQ